MAAPNRLWTQTIDYARKHTAEVERGVIAICSIFDADRKDIDVPETLEALFSKFKISEGSSQTEFEREVAKSAHKKKQAPVDIACLATERAAMPAAEHAV